MQVCIFVKYMQSGTLGIQILAHFHDGHSALTASPTERRQPTSHLETQVGIFEFCNKFLKTEYLNFATENHIQEKVEMLKWRRNVFLS